LRLNTLFIYFECTGKESVSDSEYNVSVLNRRNETNIRLRFYIVLKLGCVTPVSTNCIGMGSIFVFRFLRTGLHTDEHYSIY